MLSLIAISCGQTITLTAQPMHTQTAQLTAPASPAPKPATLSTPAQGTPAIVTAERLYIRRSVGTSEYPLGVLKRGDTVYIIACVPDTGWAVISAGYVNARFLSVTCEEK